MRTPNSSSGHFGMPVAGPRLRKDLLAILKKVETPQTTVPTASATSKIAGQPPADVMHRA